MNIQDYRDILSRIGINAQQDLTYPFRLNAMYRNLHYVFEHDDASDPFYFRIVLPVVADTNDGIIVAKETVNRFNVDFKATKIIQQGTQYHIVSEQYVFDYSTLESVVQRVVAIMGNEIVQFHQTINSGSHE